MLLESIPTVGGAEAAYVLEPIPRSDAVVLSGAGRVVPVPLGLRGGVSASRRSTFVSAVLFAPIPVAVT